MQTTPRSTILQVENQRFRGTGGRSEENHGLGFRPAFMDTDTHAVYASCFVDGRTTAFHLIDGLPDAVIVGRNSLGSAATIKASVVSGFVRQGRFYSRDEAARYVAAQPA